MGRYKRGTDDIVTKRVDLTHDLGTSTTVTANGERGTLTLKLKADVTAGGGSGTNTFTFSNTFIEADSIVNMSVVSNHQLIIWAYLAKLVDNQCEVQFTNSSEASTIANNSNIELAYRVVN